MAVISATEHRVLHVPAEPREVYDFFSRPERLREAMSSVERCEVLSEGRVRWVLDEKADAGIRFRADYTVAYDGDGAGHVRWRFVEGNMRNEGDVRILPRPDGGSEIRYRETVAPDLPVTPLTARLITPLVARELRLAIDDFLARVRKHLSA